MEKIVRKLRDENEEHPNNMILGYFNFIHHVKGKVNGLNKLAANILQPFLAETDMVDPFREHRIYVNSENMHNITNIHYIQTLFGGHRILSFTKKHPKGKEYYKMNTSFQKDH